MNVTEFAEQIVFGTTLAEKLADPGSLTLGERSSGPRVDALASPGRPRNLEMHHGPGAAQPPSDAELEDEQARGRLLHFLANHELLATELMALVLLKFPDAPQAFRRGVLVTLQEEQAHTRLYLRRMHECGVEFGSFPLSGHFWRVVEPMQSPFDFVTRLSLTFEQANLDYSRHFASVFRQLGDLDTAEILERIYVDEIGHVRHGLNWFRAWKDPTQSDWQAFQKSLTFPMSPQRARGPKGAFNREGRLKAGLTPEFVDAVEVFRQSRGRTPNVRWFDPSAEAALGHELSTTERQLMDQLCKDLECVMVPLSKQDDVLLVRRMPSMSLRKHLLDVGFDLPEFVHFDERSQLADRKLHELMPWAWTPANHQIAEPLLPATHRCPETWRDEHLKFFRKSWGAACLRKWLDDELPPEWSTTRDSIGIPFRDAGDIHEALAHFAAQGWSHAIIKQDLATSGRGQRRVASDQPLDSQHHAWLQSLVTREGGIVEPELNRVLDLSFLWQLSHDSDTPTFLGWTRPLVTESRRYIGTRLGRPFSDCDQELSQFLFAHGCARLHAVTDWLGNRIAHELLQHNFRGYFGVDSIVCRDEAGELAIKPLVELNPRVTMGHVALSLEPRLAPGVQAEFRIYPKRDWDVIHTELTKAPLSRSRDGRLQSGVVCLSDVDESTKLVPVVLVGHFRRK